MRSPSFWYPLADAKPDPRSLLLQPLAALYHWGHRMRVRFAAPERAAVPVICIGNLVAGGSGKTPLALALADRLLARGEAVHFLTRGYGGRLKGPTRVDLSRHGAAHVGDEAVMLAAHGPCWVAADRAAGARAAVSAGATLILMDDGFQNPKLHKDISLVVADGVTGFGNERLLPAGPLREPVGEGLARAQGLVIMGDGPCAASLRDAAQRHKLPVFHGALAPRGDQADLVRGQRFVAFAGIGRPEKFFSTLEQLGARLEDRISFGDHHPYSEADAKRLIARAGAAGAKLMTTEKDRARLTGHRGGPLGRLRAMVAVLPVRAVLREAGALDQLIDKGLAAARASHTYLPPGQGGGNKGC